MINPKIWRQFDKNQKDNDNDIQKVIQIVQYNSVLLDLT